MIKKRRNESGERKRREKKEEGEWRKEKVHI